MPQCAIGRAITHDDAENFPGFQQPCGKPVTQTLVIADGSSVHHHEVCGDHMRELARRGLVSDAVRVPTRS